jgi:predicted metal-dependent phosphoesterase TrpH
LFVDLHLHSSHSDGRWRPRQVVEEAAKVGLAAIALTDHDVLTGLREARAAADAHGIELIEGVELTADWDGRVCHILGYGVNPEHAGLNLALSRGRSRMSQHVEEVLREVRASGHELSEKDLARYNTRYATGTSLVLGMLERGILRRSPDAARLIALASREPRAYTAAEAIDLVHQADGLAVLAHPARLRRDQPLLKAEALKPLVEAGLDGLEAWQVVHAETAREHYLALADQLGLLATGGSDCHGPRRTGARIGSQRVPYLVLSELRARLRSAKLTSYGPA